ncbi:hypothetical protein DSLASN_10860 [Desulfoluna limicola]|uniref:Uncharacterized protein n=1 Tax=Desulfoluna limicola TaxID=2810562 RepID=A0ABM7PE51_9BACT|nr:hypothetical protein DSLASN_10860 [Desulfoluna limicola]
MINLSDDVVVSSTKWVCSNKKCIVNFTVENTTTDYLTIKISLRAYKQESVSGSDAIVNKIIGERIIETTINPRITQEFQESLNVTSKRVYLVSVNAWVDK